MLAKLLKTIKHPGFKYGIPIAVFSLCTFTLGLFNPMTLGVAVLGVVGNYVLHKKGF